MKRSDIPYTHRVIGRALMQGHVLRAPEPPRKQYRLRLSCYRDRWLQPWIVQDMIRRGILTEQLQLTDVARAALLPVKRVKADPAAKAVMKTTHREILEALLDGRYLYRPFAHQQTYELRWSVFDRKHPAPRCLRKSTVLEMIKLGWLDNQLQATDAARDVLQPTFKQKTKPQ